MISIVIPAYNRSDLIGDTIRSLLAQTVPAGEIIVVDDGSADATAEIAESFGPPVRVIRQSNGGPAAARNRGFAESRGDFIHFFDSDDIAVPNKHETQLAALIQSGADIAVGPWVKGYFVERTFTPDNHVLQQHGLPKGNLVKALMTRWAIVPHACLFRRSIIEKTGGFPEDCFGTEDTFFFLEALLQGARVVHSPDTLELYRLGNAKITNDPASSSRHLYEWCKLLIKMRQRCLTFGIEPAKWFGFRNRVWAAKQSLSRLRPEEYELIAELGSAVFDSFPAPCRLGNWAALKWGGLKKRLTGGRATASFRAGRLTPAQGDLIQQAGYRLDGRYSHEADAFRN